MATTKKAPTKKKKPAKKAPAGSLRITQVRSGIRQPERLRATLRALGIRGHQQSVVQKDGPALRGMLHKVKHLVSVVSVEDA